MSAFDLVRLAHYVDGPCVCPEGTPTFTQHSSHYHLKNYDHMFPKMWEAWVARAGTMGDDEMCPACAMWEALSHAV
jgi:hypothetical protein